MLPESAGNSHPLRPAPTEESEYRASTLRGWEFPANSGAVRQQFQTRSVPLHVPLSCPTGSNAWVAERSERFGARPRSGPARHGGRAPPTRRPGVSAYQLVERVAPNALDVGPRSAPINALGTTRSTTEARSAGSFGHCGRRPPNRSAKARNARSVPPLKAFEPVGQEGHATGTARAEHRPNLTLFQMRQY